MNGMNGFQNSCAFIALCVVTSSKAKPGVDALAGLVALGHVRSRHKHGLSLGCFGCHSSTNALLCRQVYLPRQQALLMAHCVLVLRVS